MSVCEVYLRNIWAMGDLVAELFDALQFLEDSSIVSVY